jgi:nickel-type superoxide dismutase maturation protease
MMGPFLGEEQASDGLGDLRATLPPVVPRGTGRSQVRYVHLPFQRVAVAGGSMRPTLEDGDWVLVRRVSGGEALAAGDVVVVERPDRPGLLLVKRAIRRTPTGWWVEGDATEASDDSRVFGVVPDGLVRGRAVWRYLPSPRLLGRS